MLETAIALGILRENKIKKIISLTKGVMSKTPLGKVAMKHPGKLLVGVAATGAATSHIVKRALDS